MTEVIVPCNMDKVQWGRLLVDPVPGPNERCIELPLGLAVADVQRPGWVLDAGCALLPGIIGLPASYPQAAKVVHLTQNIASETVKPRGVLASFVSADLRDLSIFADGAFERTVCLSTLEHVGMDNTIYGARSECNPESVIDAINELYRVTKSALLITVPVFSVSSGHGKWRYFTPDMVQTCPGEARYYFAVDGGWCGGELAPFPFADVPSQRPQQIACIRWER